MVFDRRGISFKHGCAQPVWTHFAVSSPKTLSPIAKETTIRPLFGYVGPQFVLESHLTFVCPQVLQLFLSVSIFRLLFNSLMIGRCCLHRSPVTARNNPTPNEGYQARMSTAKAMQVLLSKPALSALFSFPCAVPLRRTLACAHSPVPNSCPCAASSLGGFARSLLRRSETLPVHGSLALKSSRWAVLRSLRPQSLPVRFCAVPSLRTVDVGLFLRSIPLTWPRSFDIYGRASAFSFSRLATLSLSLAVPLSHPLNWYLRHVQELESLVETLSVTCRTTTKATGDCVGATRVRRRGEEFHTLSLLLVYILSFFFMDVSREFVCDGCKLTITEYRPFVSTGHTFDAAPSWSSCGML